MIALLRDEVNTKSFQTQQKYIDKVFKQDYDVFKRNESEVNNMSEEQKSNNEKNTTRSILAVSNICSMRMRRSYSVCNSSAKSIGESVKKDKKKGERIWQEHTEKALKKREKMQKK